VSDRAAIELFHLAFVAELGRKLDSKLYAIKGGCNLRFFFRSPRYSEDLDIDLQTVELGTLRSKVTRLLDSRSLGLVLGAKELRIVRQSAPKQTETTQRWKVDLERTEGGSRLHTKIEFSRRRRRGETAFDPVDPLLIAEHGVPALFATHYTALAAFAQKISALAHRRETQARDVFDLDLLLRSGASVRTRTDAPRADITRAQANALGVGFDAFQGQVLAFLPADEQAAFRDARAWERLVLRVVDALEGLSA
jgi:predicted nucleotidyltransferase component of viral defense system